MNMEHFLWKKELRNDFQKGIYFHHFQPIVNLSTNEVFGFESLLRSNFVQNPLFLFHMAKKLNMLNDFDLLSIETALKNYQSDEMLRGKELFINVFPSTASLPSFSDFIKKLYSNNVHLEKIVLEISELEDIDDFPSFKRSIFNFQHLGIAIAIDDVGAGAPPFQKLVELAPDYLKLDKYFAKDVHLSTKKQQLIQLFLQYCANFGVEVILEGIEKQEELLVAKELGIQYGQGFLLGKPTTLDDIS